MEIFLSIVIPAFNAEQYLEHCIDSIVRQKAYQKCNGKLFEIIVVDDCSKDNTYAVATKYKQSHDISNMQIIRHESNKQQGAARNTGIHAAQGKYLWFVDVDDYLEENILDVVFNAVWETELDVFQFNALAESLDGKKHGEAWFEKTVGPMSGLEYLTYEASVHYENRIRATWSKWFRKDFLIQNNLFYEEHVYWEDVVHTLKCIYYAQSFVYMPVVGYIYVQTPNSDMRGKQNGKKYSDTIKFCVDSIEFMTTVQIPKTLCEFLGEYYERVLRKYRQNLHGLSKEEFDVFDRNVETMNTSIFEGFWNSDEHNWICSTSGRLSEWRK